MRKLRISLMRGGIIYYGFWQNTLWLHFATRIALLQPANGTRRIFLRATLLRGVQPQFCASITYARHYAERAKSNHARKNEYGFCNEFRGRIAKD